MTLPVVFTANGPSGYNLTKSLRFRSSATAYLNRTPASTTNQKTWTWSGWIKQGKLGATNYLMTSGVSSYPSIANNYTLFGFSMAGFYDSTDRLKFLSSVSGSTQIELVTSATYRDPSAWYHVVLAVDTTQATASNRVKLYVNGSQVTSFAVSTYPTQNSDVAYINNSSYIQYIGQIYYYGNYDGYMAEVNFIDGQQLTPSSFGSTNSLTGVWQPAKYTGTYGTNGFYLPFTNTTSTTTLGYDFSGNGNNWTTNNISLTSGSTYDSMTDVPTLTSATTANYCVVNPINQSGQTITNGNLTTQWSLTAAGQRSTFAIDSGKWYWEVTMTSISNQTSVGIVRTDSSLTVDFVVVGSNAVAYLALNGNKYINGTASAYGAAFATNNVIGVAVDIANNTVTFYKDGTTQGTITGLSLSGYSWYAACCNSNNQANQIVDYNFGQRPFTYTPPTGFKALNTYNLPSSTIVKGNTVMDATLYTGNGSARSITNTAGFKPDLVWTKSRSNTWSNLLMDSVRGVYSLSSNSTAAESSSPQAVTAYNSNGYSLGTDAGVNNNTDTYVGWQWQAGQGTTSTNTNGSITSTVSVNAFAGFSVATFTSPSSGTCSFGHGLGVTPAFVIVKSRASGNWICEHTSTGTQYLLLNGTGAATTDSTVFNSAPTSSVVNLGTGFAGSVNYVAYCWTPIAGFSAFGSYTGNGSADGPFVYLGFRPKFVMFKRSDGASNWLLLDSSRSPYNLVNQDLYADSSIAESTGGGIDFLSNGFKWRGTDTPGNGTTGTYIYMAFAENPFKNALAR